HRARAVSATPARTPVLDDLIAAMARDAFEHAVAGGPAALLAVGELLPYLWTEAPEQVEERRRISTHEGSGQRQVAAAGLGQCPRRDPLGGAACLVLVALVRDEQ